MGLTEATKTNQLVELALGPRWSEILPEGSLGVFGSKREEGP